MSARKLYVGPTAGAVSAGEVATLQHEVGDDAVELAALVALAGRLGGQLGEVLHRLRHRLAEQSDLDAAGRLTADGDVKPHLSGGKGGHRWQQEIIP